LLDPSNRFDLASGFACERGCRLVRLHRIRKQFTPPLLIESEAVSRESTRSQGRKRRSVRPGRSRHQEDGPTIGIDQSADSGEGSLGSLFLIQGKMQRREQSESAAQMFLVK